MGKAGADTRWPREVVLGVLWRVDEDSDLILKPCRTFLFPRGILSLLSCVNLFCFALQELFVETIAKDAYVYAQQGKRKTLQRKDLDNAIEAIDEFAFLEGTLD
ncbi:DNA polymerase epsilon subunit 4 [Geospiza fortis]|uniref:DNA polymerase epsilon subunit 4 n=1 Tax=Geospiza fortis TaxID=48883 RepID=A0A8N5I2E9_GEOFO|nr:DNA polymerase epsilon subunit 4 [Geospiza fortis]